jgi:hypothetical protein
MNEDQLSLRLHVDSIDIRDEQSREEAEEDITNPNQLSFL